MKVQSLSDIYTSLGVKKGTIYVVPLIRARHADSDYLFQLYKPFFGSSDYQIESISIFKHYRFVVAALLNKEIVLHYHWLEFQDLRSLLGMPWKLLCIFLFKLLGGTLVWTVHNLEPHDQKWLSSHLRIHRWIAKKADVIHIHCSSSAILVAQKFKVKDQKLRLHPHPSFPSKKINRSDSIVFLNDHFKLNLKKETPIILLFGQISEYKNIEDTLDTIQKENLDVQVIIAGTIKKGQELLGKRLEERSKNNSKINLIHTFIEDNEIPYFFNAADLCFFNYEKILTSGVVLLAQSYNKRIIAPNIGCLSELISNEHVKLFSSDKEKRELLNDVISTLSNE